MGKIKKEKVFGGKGAEENQALWDALHQVAKDEDKDVYDWLDDTPRTTLVVFLVDELHR